MCKSWYFMGCLNPRPEMSIPCMRNCEVLTHTFPAVFLLNGDLTNRNGDLTRENGGLTSKKIELMMTKLIVHTRANDFHM